MGILFNKVKIVPNSHVTPTPTVTPTSSVTPTPTVTPTSSVTPTPTVTPTNTVTPTSSLTPTNTPTPTVTSTATVTPTATPIGIVSSNLLLHYNTFNTSSYNGSGTTITDLSGNSRNGTITGSPTWTGNYFTFVDDYITSPNLSSLITSANEVHSVELWVYPTNSGVLIQYNNSTSPNTSYHASSIEIVGGNLEVGLWNGIAVSSTGNIGVVSFNQWHQIVLTYNGSVCKGYIDGVYKGSVNVAWDSPMDSSMPFYMNFGYADTTSHGDGTNFDGRFGIMRVYNKALTDAEVLSNYNSTVLTIIEPTPTPTVTPTVTSTPTNTVTPTPSPDVTVFNVTNSGASAYTINGSSNPTLTLREGQTYTFNVSASGHPFWIKTSPTTGTGNQYNNGVTNNGTQSGTITFVVPYNAPSTLYYICQYHGSMVGTINIIDVSV